MAENAFLTECAREIVNAVQQNDTETAMQFVEHRLAQLVGSFTEPDDCDFACETCNKPLPEGTLAFHCDDGPYLCAEHAPTWGDAEQNWGGDPNDPDDEASRADFRQALRAHLAAGGSKDDKLPCCPM